MTRHEVDVAGRRLAWIQSGSGASIVLLHAFPLSAEMWAPQHDAVPPGWQLVTPDMRGFGRSVGPPATSVDDHADDVLALMRHLGIERAVIGGVSMGGYLALALYRRAPQRFAGLVLADTRAEPDTEAGRAARVSLQQTAREQGPAAVADAMVPKLLGPVARAAGELPDRVHALIRSNRVQPIVDALEALKTRPDSIPTLATVSCPALVVVGADDELTPVAASETLHRGIGGGSTLSIVPAAGHLASLEQPAAFNRALQTFLGTL